MTNNKYAYLNNNGKYTSNGFVSSPKQAVKQSDNGLLFGILIAIAIVAIAFYVFCVVLK